MNKRPPNNPPTRGLRPFALLAMGASLLMSMSGPLGAQPDYSWNKDRSAEGAGTLLSGPNARSGGRTAQVAWHNGVLFTAIESPDSIKDDWDNDGEDEHSDRTTRAWDLSGAFISDSTPSNPGVIATWEGVEHAFSAHGHIKVEDTLMITRNYEIDYSTGTINTVNNSAADIEFTDKFSRGGIHAPWQLPNMWSYGSPADPFTIERRYQGDSENTVLTTFNHLEMTGVAGHSFLLGNILLVAGDHSDSGVAAYDISDLGTPENPKAPVLLDTFNTSEGIGAYWPEIWSTPEDGGRIFLVFPRREDGGRIQFVEVTDPTNLRHAGTMSFDNGLLPSQSNTAYAQFQDHYLFTDHFKIDLTFLTDDRAPVVDDVVVDFDEDNDGVVNDPDESDGPGYPWLYGRSETVDMSQFALPIGNLVASGGLNEGQGMGLWVHDVDPDTNPPYVGFHIPRDGAADYPVDKAVSIMIPETLETMNLSNGNTFFCREVGGSGSVPGYLSWAMSDILTFTPHSDLTAGATYEVILTQDALTDAVGNALRDDYTGTNTIVGKETAYRFTFTTNDGSNTLPDISNVSFSSAGPYELSNGEAIVGVSFSGSDSADNLEWRIDFGGRGGQRNRIPDPESDADGWEQTGSTSFNTGTQNFTYTEPGNYRILLQVREEGTLTRVATKAVNIVIHEPLPANYPTRSSTIAVDEANNVAWVVDPDNDVLRRIDIVNETLLGGEIATGAHPAGVAVDKNGRAWVVNRDADQIQVFNSGGGLNSTIPLEYGDRPISVVFEPAGDKGYVALEGGGAIARLDADSPGSLDGRSQLPEGNGLFVDVYGRVAQDITVFDADDIEYGRLVYSKLWTDPVHEDIFREKSGNASTPDWQDAGPLGGFRARGWIEIPNSGDWTFTETGSPEQDAYKVRIDGQVVIDLDSTDDIPSGTINLDAGVYPIEIIYIHDSSNFSVGLQWEGPGTVAAEVPASAYVIPERYAKPRALTVNSDGSTLLASQFITNGIDGTVWKFDLGSAFAASPTPASPIELSADMRGALNQASSRGRPNYLLGLTFDFTGQRAWFAGKEENVLTGMWRDRGISEDGDNIVNTLDENDALTFETTIRSWVQPFEVGEPDSRSLFDLRIDVDNNSMPADIQFSPLGTQVFIPMLDNNRVVVLDPYTGREQAKFAVGLAPEGIAFVQDQSHAQRNKFFVHNLMSRDVYIYDGNSAVREGSPNFGGQTPTVLSLSEMASEQLDANELRGKQLFYSARDIDDPAAENPVTGAFKSRMSQDGYMACANCHLDGGSDEAVYDFTNRGEGLRNTISLRGRRATAHGNMHWSGNFDELQDFELDIVNHFGGTGLIEDGDPNPALGAANSNRSDDLDDLARYVETLGADSVERSPHRTSSGELTTLAQSGRDLFNGTTIPSGMSQALNCVTCHNPASGYTESTLGTATLRDIGTLKPSSGDRLGGGQGSLTGIDTPTLLGLHATAPYLHDGSAPTLRQVFDQFDATETDFSADGAAHNLSLLSQTEKDQLIAYLLQIDGGNDSSQPVADAGTLELADSTATVNHNGGTVGPFTVNRTGGSTGSVSVQYRTISGTADGDVDYKTTSGVLTFADGVTTGEIPAITIYDDTEEGDETFSVELALPDGGATVDSAKSLLEVTIIGYHSSSTAVLTASMHDQQSDNTVDELLTDEMEAARYAGQNRNKAGLIVIELPDDLSQSDLDNLTGAVLEIGLGGITDIGDTEMPNTDVYAVKMDSTATIDPADWDSLYGNMADTGLSGTKVIDDFVTGSTPIGRVFASAAQSTDLADYIAANYTQTNR
ncbi:MAG: Calx-beta domain-containing protein, partial [Opitutales bacterium]